MSRTAAVIGAGPMGLACAYELLKRGWQVSLYEKDSRIGGMSASFDLDGLKIERYYHFICAPDHALFEYLKEFGIYDKLRWRETKMGFYYNGRLRAWGNPWALLAFPGLDPISKLRYGLHVLYTKNVKDWAALDKIGATEWLHKWLGKKGYDVLWKSLFELKFFEHKDRLSAAWLGTRIKRVALSRKSIFVERLGYIEGGSDVLLHAIERRIRDLGGTIELSADVQEIVIEKGRLHGVKVNGRQVTYDRVISTIPLPYLKKIAGNLPPEEINKIAAIENIGVVCVTLKLKRSLSENFWININDPTVEIPGLIEYSNLNPLAHTVLYAPFYMPKTNPKYQRDKQAFIEEVIGYLSRINPAFTPDWVLATNAFRYEFAQTICTPDFFHKLPPKKSAVSGLYMADTSHYYPEDRSISESMLIGRELAEMAHASVAV